jgi:hypothetical protein
VVLADRGLQDRQSELLAGYGSESRERDMTTSSHDSNERHASKRDRREEHESTQLDHTSQEHLTFFNPSEGGTLVKRAFKELEN